MKRKGEGGAGGHTDGGEVHTSSGPRGNLGAGKTSGGHGPGLLEIHHQPQGCLVEGRHWRSAREGSRHPPGRVPGEARGPFHGRWGRRGLGGWLKVKTVVLFSGVGRGEGTRGTSSVAGTRRGTVRGNGTGGFFFFFLKHGRRKKPSRGEVGGPQRPPPENPHRLHGEETPSPRQLLPYKLYTIPNRVFQIFLYKNF